MTNFTLEDLETIVAARAGSTDGSSYTATLARKGAAHTAKKLGEEAVETIIAGTSEGDEALRQEAADLLYHLLVLLECRGVAIGDVLQVLEGRAGLSGLQEKADRAKR